MQKGKTLPGHNSLVPERHPSLPRGLTDTELEVWLRQNAVETYFDEKKVYFGQDEIKEFALESSAKGREMNRLTDLLADVTAAVRKGIQEPVTITIPVTVGTKLLDVQRRQNDDFIERGYTVEETEIFGIPNADTLQMEYFDLVGNIHDERSRSMSAKERHQYAGMFDNFQKDKDGNTFDGDTGEVLGETGM